MLFSLYARLQICLNYAVNQDYYATVLCENKAVKNSRCKGKCAMQKELANLSAKEDVPVSKNDNGLFKINKAEEALVSIFNFNVSFVSLAQVFEDDKSDLRMGTFSRQFRPPRQIFSVSPNLI